FLNPVTPQLYLHALPTRRSSDLGIIIVVLGYWLYVSITEPWAVVEQERAMTEQTRERMDDVRTALIRYQRTNQRFPSSLDSLMIDRKSTRLNSSHVKTSYAVFCL